MNPISNTSNALSLSYCEDWDLCTTVINTYILTSNTNPNIKAISMLMTEELPKMGINADLITLSPISTNSRTFQNKLATPKDGIPNFKNGGFDLFIGNISSSFNYDPSLFYSSNSFAPKGNNIAYFQNNTMEDLLKAYNQTIDPIEKLSIGYQIQQIAYQELPYIPILSQTKLWCYSNYLNLSNSSLFMMAFNNFNSYWSKLTSVAGVTNVTYYMPSVITKFLPNIENSISGSLLLSSLWSKLYERNPNYPNLNYQPVMAASMPVYVDSAKTIAQIKLRDNVTFSNGDPVTAQDVVNAYHMAMTPKFGFANYQKYMSYFDTANYGNNSVSAINSTTVQFRLKSPFFDAISLFNEPVLDQNIVGSYTNPITYDLNSDPINFSIGKGPFKIDTINSTSDTVIFIKNSNWWAENITDWFGGELNSIIFRYNVKKSDVLFYAKQNPNYILDGNYNFILTNKLNFPGLSHQSEPTQQMIIMAVNMHNPYFGTGLETPLGKLNPARAAKAARYIRQAIAYIIPQQDIIDSSILNGMGSTVTTLWPSYSPGYNSSLPVRGYNIAKANKLAEMAGYSLRHSYNTNSTNTPYYSSMISVLTVITAINIGRKRFKKVRKFR